MGRPARHVQADLKHIDLLILLDHDFRSAVSLLERWLDEHEAKAAKK